VTSETWLLDADDPAGEFRVVWPRKDGVEYDVEHVVAGGKDRLLVVHNDGAVNFELVSVAASDPQGAARMLLPHDPAVRLEGVDAFRDFVAVEYRREGLPRVAIAKVPPAGLPADATPDDTLHELSFDEALFSVGVGSNPDWEQPTLRIGYSSFVTPSTVYDVVVATGERRLRKQQPVLGDYDPSRTRSAASGRWPTTARASRSRWCTGTTSWSSARRAHVALRLRLLRALDRSRVRHPPSLAARPRHDLRGRARARRRRDGAALVRARQEVRQAQHLHRLRRRGAAPHRRGRHAPDRLVAQGGSAGGLLMGAVANMGPRHFSGILAEVPFVDPLTSILDPSLPLTVIEWDEWGNPLDDAEVYAYMKSYSPYENVHVNHYPPILA
jgi:oligopeptidase B